MAGTKNSKIKLLYLMEIFIEKTDEDNILSAEDFCLELSKKGITAERKSIYSDIEVLREFGLDIINTTAPRRGYFLAQRDFEVAEVRLLIDAVQAAGFISAKKTKQLIEKIERLVSLAQADRLSNQVYIDNRHKSNNEEIYYNIDVLHHAIECGIQVQLKYIKRIVTQALEVQNEERIFTVNPYALIWANDHYYLVCNNPKYDNLIHLRIDRMKKVVLTDTKARHFSEVSRFKDHFDSAAYVNEVFNMFTGDAKSIELICDNSIIEEIMDRFGEKTPLILFDENHFSVKITAAFSCGLINWIMQFGDSIKVKSPAELQDMLAEKASKVVSLYRG